MPAIPSAPTDSARAAAICRVLAASAGGDAANRVLAPDRMPQVVPDAASFRMPRRAPDRFTYWMPVHQSTGARPDTHYARLPDGRVMRCPPT